MDFTRRMLIYSAAAFSAKPALAAKKLEVHRFRTRNLDIEMTIEFHDRYRSSGFWFREQASSRGFCLSTKGEENRNCKSAFHGSVAIAKFKVRANRPAQALPMLREYVRTVDRDASLPIRPPFERTIELDQGVGSDLQAFGYEAALEGKEDKPVLTTHGPWYLFRQDLFLEPEPKPFLVVLWKHALTSIRVLDLIPGDQTWEIEK
jgi:hypothetical protein